MVGIVFRISVTGDDDFPKKILRLYRRSLRRVIVVVSALVLFQHIDQSPYSKTGSDVERTDAEKRHMGCFWTLSDLSITKVKVEQLKEKGRIYTGANTQL